MRSETRTSLLAVLAALLMVPLLAAPASADSHGVWAQWEPLSGSANDYRTEMSLPVTGFPTAQVTSDSRAGSVGVISGASTWLAEGTAVGATYGSSRNQPYLNLRPRADNLASPSVTTYTFESPTPASGWAFVLGDIDADQVQVTAMGPDGGEVTAAELGFRGGFNYCAPEVTGRPSCTGEPDDVALWDPATQILSGNADAVDTSGAAGWFEPTVPIATLTFTFTRLTGFPIYQTWFAAFARDIAGTVTETDGTTGAGGVTLNLYDTDGELIATTTSEPDGSYEFPGYAAYEDYVVEVEAPDGRIAVGPTRQTVDLSDDHAADVDFQIRDIVPTSVSGTVRDDDGNPLSGVTVTLTDEDGTSVTATTNSTGGYLFDTLQPGTYELEAETPDGYRPIDAPGQVVVPADSEEPITDQDFIFAEHPAISGQVTAGGAPVAGVPVTATGSDGSEYTTFTDTDGAYRLQGLPPDDYTVSVTPPEPYLPGGPESQDVTLGDDDLMDVDFELIRPGSIAGVVREVGGDPVAGVAVLVDGPGGQVALTSDDEGGYAVGGLLPGTYQLTVSPPDGYTVVGEGTLTVTITAAGEAIFDQDFVLDLAVVPADQDVSGIVRDDGGDPVANVTVTVTDTAGDLVATVETGADGVWSTSLAPGEYTATVSTPDGYRTEVIDLEFSVFDEPVTGLDFVLIRDLPTSPAPSEPPQSESPPGSGAGHGPPLAETGIEAAGALALGTLLLLAGAAVALRARTRSA